MLYCGEKIGTGKPPEVDVALDPLDGTTIIAQVSYKALSGTFMLSHWLAGWAGPDVSITLLTYITGCPLAIRR